MDGREIMAGDELSASRITRRRSSAGSFNAAEVRHEQPMICSSCGTGYDSPATSCPACGTHANVAAPRIGLFALACLHIARVAALVNVLAVLAAGGVLAWNAHYFLPAFLVLLGAPVSIGHFVAFGLLIDYAQTKQRAS
jgi:hypothetical protein